MVEFRGIILRETSAEQKKLSPVKNMDVDIVLDGLESHGEDILVNFIYTVTYQPDIGKLMFKGTVAFTDKADKLSEYKKYWGKNKIFPEELMGPLMNLINITSTVNGVLVCRAINLAPPLIPPKLELLPQKMKTANKPKK